MSRAAAPMAADFVPDLHPADAARADQRVRVVQPQIQATPGVKTAEILGARYFALRAWLDPSKLAAFGLTADDVLAYQEVSGEISARLVDAVSGKRAQYREHPDPTFVTHGPKDPSSEAVLQFIQQLSMSVVEADHTNGLIDTLDQDNVRKLSVILLIDLLRIERDPQRAPSDGEAEAEPDRQ